MRLLLSNARAQSQRGGLMVLYNPQPLVKDALVTAGFEQLIPMFDEFDAACAALQTAVTPNPMIKAASVDEKRPTSRLCSLTSQAR